MTPRQADTLLQALAAAYPRHPFSKGTRSLYMAFLVGLDYEAAHNGVKRHIATSKWFPTVAEIRDAAAAESAPALEADQAWPEVLAAVSRYGRNKTPEFADPMISKAVDAVGWDAICNSTNIGVERAHFLRAFDAIRRRHVDAARMEGLPPSPPIKRLGAMKPLAELLPARSKRDDDGGKSDE
jgi:hypothetical protein